MVTKLQEYLKNEMALLKKEGLFRELKTIRERKGAWVDLQGRKILDLSSNDYLGLATDPRLAGAFREALVRHGAGSAASRLISGNMSPHEELESAIANFKGAESALLFNSGYHANTGAIPALFGKKDLILSDELNHASIIDGCRLSKAKVLKYPHKDCYTLRKFLRENRDFEKVGIITDGVFSMDGDIAPLPEIAEMAREFDAVVMVDDAHGVGVLGSSGRGTLEHFGLGPESVAIHMGTLGKALGCFGAYVAGEEKLRQFLINKARSFIFTTALPPALAMAVKKAIEIVQSEPSLRERLWENVRFFKERLEDLGLDTMESETPIIPILTGDASRTMEIHRKLLEEGLFIQGVRPPTVPQGKSRLRATLSAAHTREDLEFALKAMGKVLGAGLRRPTSFVQSELKCLTRNPQRATRNPQRATRNAQRATRNAQRATRNPQPATRNPQRATRNPQRATRNAQRATRNAQRATRNPQPATRNPQRATRNPQPATRNAQRATRNAQRATRNAQRATRNPQRFLIVMFPALPVCLFP